MNRSDSILSIWFSTRMRSLFFNRINKISHDLQDWDETLEDSQSVAVNPKNLVNPVEIAKTSKSK